MPVAVARQMLFCNECKLDSALEPLGLTHEQAWQYALPSIPIKYSDRRRGSVAQRYGSGATALDALAALHPGELERRVTKAIQ